MFKTQRMVFLKQINKKRYLQELIPLAILLAVIVPVILPYFHAGFFPTHDGEWAVVRLVDMFRSIKDFQLPVRYSGSLNFGYGYPLFNFAYPLPYYAGLVFVLLQFGFVGSIKALFVVSILSSALGMYFLSRTVFKSIAAGVMSAIMYTYIPYHLVDLFVRGSIGESLAFGLFPFILLFVFKIFSSDKKMMYALWAGIFLGLLILTHNIMAVLFMPVLVTSIIALYITKRINYLYIIIIFLVGFGLSAFFFIPALLEKDMILLSVIPIADRSLYFIKPLDLLWSPFGYGTPTDPDAFTYQIGIPLIIAFILISYLTLKKYVSKTYGQTDILVGFLSILTIFFVAMLFSQTAFLWEHLPLLSEINYPWTLLSQIGFVLSFLVGYLMIQTRIITLCVYALVICTVLLYGMYARPSEYIDRGDMFYLTNLATTTSSNELMPIWVKTQPIQNLSEKVVVLNGEGTVENLINTSDLLSFKTSLPKPSDLRVQTIYYPGWKAYVNGSEVQINYDNEFGVMDLSLPQGTHDVTFVLTETPVRMVSNVISLLTLFCAGSYMVYFILTLSRKKHEK